MKMLYTIVKKELKENETIFISTKSKINSLHDEEWWKFEEYTFDEIFNNISGKERVYKYWHEDGLCIILNK